MARTLTFDRARVDFVEFRVDEDTSSVQLRVGITAQTPDGYKQDYKIEGWGSLSSEQQDAFIGALSALVHARLMEILAVNPATHTLVQDGPNFQEVPK